MANDSAGVPEAMPRPVANSHELVTKLESLVNSIRERGVNYSVQAIDEATDTLAALKIEVDSQKVKKRSKRRKGTPMRLKMDYVATYGELQHFSSLLERMLPNHSDQNASAKELRQLIESRASTRVFFNIIPDAISKLISPLTPGSADARPDLLDDVIAIVKDIVLLDANKGLFAEATGATVLLIESLIYGNQETMSNAATAINHLVKIDSYKHLFSDALYPLIFFLQQKDESVIKDAASAIFELCRLSANKECAVNHGLIKVVVEYMSEGIYVDQFLSILALLATDGTGVKQMLNDGAVSLLLKVLATATSEDRKEHCVRILSKVCFNAPETLKEIGEEETAHCTFSRLAESSTASGKAKEKAKLVLEMLKNNPCVPSAWWKKLLIP